MQSRYRRDSYEEHRTAGEQRQPRPDGDGLESYKVIVNGEEVVRWGTPEKVAALRQRQAEKNAASEQRQPNQDTQPEERRYGIGQKIVATAMTAASLAFVVGYAQKGSAAESIKWMASPVTNVDNLDKAGTLAAKGYFGFLDLLGLGADEDDLEKVRREISDNRATPDPKTSPEPTPEETATGELPTDPTECVSQLPDEFLIVQNSTIPVQQNGASLSGETFLETKKIVDEFGIGGLVVFGDPSKDSDRNILKYTEDTIATKLIGIDQEGGIVKRVDNGMPSQREVSTTMSAEQAEQEMAKYYTVLKELGINAVFGPVIDKEPLRDKAQIEVDRLISGDEYHIEAMATAYIKAIESQGLIPFGKHFIGGGHMSAHTDKSDGPTSVPDLATLDEEGALSAWKTLGEKDTLDNIMFGTSIIKAPEGGESASDNLPMAISPSANDMAINEYKLDGIRITDDLGTKAVVDENGKPLELKDAVIRSLSVGATPLWVQQQNETNGPVALRPLIESIIEYGTEAIETNQLDRATLHEMTNRRYEILEVDGCQVLRELKQSDYDKAS